MSKPDQSLAERLLRAYVEHHDRGVRTGDSTALVGLFASDGVLAFEGGDLGPFVGREQIADAFARTPPGDELVVSDVTASPGGASAHHAWRGDPAAPGGTLRLEVRDGAIGRLTIVPQGWPGPLGIMAIARGALVEEVTSLSDRCPRAWTVG